MGTRKLGQKKQRMILRDCCKWAKITPLSKHFHFQMVCLGKVEVEVVTCSLNHFWKSPLTMLFSADGMGLNQQLSEMDEKEDEEHL